ncbi:hypothetical protein RM543_10405 [Roseicyclus sp. F158]|uniref:RiboL-PSP-HEPN domain-containing protein n=1 Tax=Tropicimonas omnivorans TaxID=3075590 RepID=A0ABU3DHR6_9RHOB|nr:hypothetical protein [Roseicyclus sp. F158]MDT0683098.1 hypothetical protein [Roseicyclus sp. F158]
MAAVEVNYSKSEEHPVGADRLFKVMMRLEFALKEIGYCKTAGNQKAEVDWDRFANERLGASFFNAMKAEGSVNVLLQTPPKRQIGDGQGYLSWKQVGAVSNIQELVGSLRRVRNNLFHGGKSGDPDKDRDDVLVGNALSSIDAILRHDHDLRMMFEGKH